MSDQEKSEIIADIEKKQIAITYKMLYTFIAGTLTVIVTMMGSAAYVARGWQKLSDRVETQEKRQDKLELRQDHVEAIAYQIKLK